jgi:hypothetical protein
MERQSNKQKAKAARPVGAPRKHDRDALLAKIEAYIEETEVPIAAEFAYRNGLCREQLYEMPELSHALRKLITKKEASLDRKAQMGEMPVPFAIFSLKQLGWRDNQDINHSGSVSYKVIPDKEAHE